MESRVLKLAICYFGSKDNQKEILSAVEDKFKDYEIYFFPSIGADKYFEFWKSAILKREFEIKNAFEFDICLGISSDRFISLDHIELKELSVNTIYYTSGFYNKSSHQSAATFNLFFSKSLEFDRLSEFFHSRTFINTGLKTEAEQFLYHIKTLDFDAECINLENRSLFIRPA